MTLTPLFDRLLVRRLEAETTTAGGIVLPDQAVEKPQQGTVVAKGPGTKHVQAGDRVLFSKFVGTEVDVDGEALLVMYEQDVLAIVTEVA